MNVTQIRQQVEEIIWNNSYNQSWLDKPKEAYTRDTIQPDKSLSELFDDPYYVKTINDIEVALDITLPFIWNLDYKRMNVEMLVRAVVTGTTNYGDLSSPKHFNDTIKEMEAGHSRIIQQEFKQIISDIRERYEKNN